jgi:glycosyltransferase involved in cell wall biosynthesis
MVGPGPIRVLHISTRLNIGGAALEVIVVAERLQDEEFRSALLIGDVSPAEGSLEGVAAQRRVPLIRVPGLGRNIAPGRDSLVLWRLYREIRRFRPHIVHTHLAKAGALGRVAARLARVPVVVHTYHGHVFHGYFSKRTSDLVIRIERALARWTDRLIVMGETQEREILGFGVGLKEQMVRLPAALELEPLVAAEKCRGALRRELGVPADRPLVGIVARLVPVKAHELFLEAARQVAGARPDCEFLVVGDGERRGELEQAARGLGFRVVSHGPDGCPRPAGASPTPPHSPTPTLPHSHPPTPPHPHTPTPPHPAPQPAVRFLGFRSDLPAVYADLDVVVLCSRNEGLPATVIEALAAARPVVATDVGEVRDLILPDETGLLAPSGDAGALAAGILKVLEQPEAAALMARRGRERVYPRLSIDRLESDIRRLYRDLAASKGLVPFAVEGSIAPS